MRLEQYRAALYAFFERRAEEIQRSITTYKDHRLEWLARKAELELVQRAARAIDPHHKGNGDGKP